MFPLNKTAKVFGVAFVIALGVIVYGASGTPSTLRVKTDANHALLVANGGAQVNPVTSSTFNNTRLATDASGNLLVVGSGGGGIVGGSCPSGFLVAIDSAGNITCSDVGDGQRNIGQPLNIAGDYFIQSPATNIPEFESTTGVNAIAWNLRLPTLGAGWGSGATLSTHSLMSQGQVTLGTAPSATTLVLSTDSSFGTPQCVVQNISTPVLLKYAYDSGTGDITFTGTGFVAGNVIEWICTDRRGS